MTQCSENHGFGAGTLALSVAGPPGLSPTTLPASTKMKLLSLLMLSSAGAAAGRVQNETAPAAQPAAAPSPPWRRSLSARRQLPAHGLRNEKNDSSASTSTSPRSGQAPRRIAVEFKPIDWSATEAELNGKRVDALWNGLTSPRSAGKNIGFTSACMGEPPRSSWCPPPGDQDQAELAAR